MVNPGTKRYNTFIFVNL